MTKSKIIVLLCLSAMLLNVLPASAQVKVEAKLDPIAIYIGEQADLAVTVTAKQGDKVEFLQAERGQMIVPGVEVISSTIPDSVSLSDDSWQTTKHYVVTAFDENLYAITPITVNVNGKPHSANTLALKVVTVDVDTLHPNQFFPPKDVQDNPFMWEEWSKPFWASLLMILLLAACCYFYIRLKENKPILARIRIIKRLLPHQKAMKSIENIKSSRSVLMDDQKEYYTQLTDTLRKYIEERFHFNAMEMTSSEIIDRLSQAEDSTMLDELTELFRTADLVKFAKYSALINENDLNLVNAINFIDQTKQEGGVTEERIVDQPTTDEKKSQNNRIVIKAILWLLFLLIVLIVVYVAQSIYQLI